MECNEIEELLLGIIVLWQLCFSNSVYLVQECEKLIINEDAYIGFQLEDVDNLPQVGNDSRSALYPWDIIIYSFYFYV